MKREIGLTTTELNLILYYKYLTDCNIFIICMKYLKINSVNSIPLLYAINLEEIKNLLKDFFK